MLEFVPQRQTRSAESEPMRCRRTRAAQRRPRLRHHHQLGQTERFYVEQAWLRALHVRRAASRPGPVASDCRLCLRLSHKSSSLEKSPTSSRICADRLGCAANQRRRTTSHRQAVGECDNKRPWPRTYATASPQSSSWLSGQLASLAILVGAIQQRRLESPPLCLELVFWSSCSSQRGCAARCRPRARTRSCSSDCPEPPANRRG